ncbi:MAG: hypothetical protein ACKOWH_01710 [Rhodoluna sp.]
MGAGKLIRVPRWSVAILALLYASYHSWLALMSFESYTNHLFAWIAISIYFATMLPSILLYPKGGIPTAQAIANFLAAGLIPILVNSQIESWSTNVYSTWYVGGIGTLMAATAIRRHKAWAWAGLVVMTAQVLSWAGVDSFFRMGLPGAFLLVFAAHSISLGLVAATKNVNSYIAEKLQTESLQAATTAARVERQSRIEKALLGALPMLQKILKSSGALTDLEKTESRLLEASLRDEIRGRAFMNDAIQRTVRNLRERGVEVIILDEGGLDGTGATERETLLNMAATAISKVDSGRITLRAPKGESWKITVAATRPGVATPDIWLKL